MGVPTRMDVWTLGSPGELRRAQKPVPSPGRGEVLVRIEAVAICATDLEIIANGPPALINGRLPFEQDFTPGHEYMGAVAALGPGVDEYAVGDRVAVEIHAGCGQCRRCRSGMYTSCLNYGRNYGDVDKGHRANGFTTDGGFAQYAVNHVNTLVRVPDAMGDEEATLAVTAGTSMYGLTELGGLVAGESVVVIGPGPIGLLAVGVAKALGASPVVLVGTRENRLDIGSRLGADVVLNGREVDAVARIRELTGVGADYVLDCAGTEASINDAIHMCSRGGRICLAAFPHGRTNVDLEHAVVNNMYLYGIRGEGKSAVRRAMALMAARRFDASLIHTHTFDMDDLPEAIRYARDRVDDAIKVVVRPRH
ncbi:zinc-dependent alcohol dehydrogenase [Sphingomonas corticis]|uniref:Alcohol dehydrogenase catalytic domain-containing protein n=1 Tax=Sphingomonas corticis TaxID=2722791 RepID=A0ABX1CRQ3_9SPHN|nr:alcohol dehydrogenase catalytic domain-containing protein [Sphingomonas corticis]NJR80609.1 alcohol dehydrogenase catalytic domain-containing protein [Sphingomonas corticis]